ncbi:hypothetical protein [uncultured Celeribacter sp.]|uniref:hypothetical protein n=1 Tax=uncultured Celeribacter sp. TaxID=1303376 RepID=UPI002AA6869E|nr:hypothetical protein [uncultured Celeribacter sp.]
MIRPVWNHHAEHIEITAAFDGILERGSLLLGGFARQLQFRLGRRIAAVLEDRIDLAPQLIQTTSLRKCDHPHQSVEPRPLCEGLRHPLRAFADLVDEEVLFGQVFGGDEPMLRQQKPGQPRQVRPVTRPRDQSRPQKSDETVDAVIELLSFMSEIGRLLTDGWPSGIRNMTRLGDENKLFRALWPQIDVPAPVLRLPVVIRVRRQGKPVVPLRAVGDLLAFHRQA